jgi:hypothetical protein
LGNWRSGGGAWSCRSAWGRPDWPSYRRPAQARSVAETRNVERSTVPPSRRRSVPGRGGHWRPGGRGWRFTASSMPGSPLIGGHRSSVIWQRSPDQLRPTTRSQSSSRSKPSATPQSTASESARQPASSPGYGTASSASWSPPSTSITRPTRKSAKTATR